MARSGSPGDLQDFWKEFEDIESSKKENEEEEETSKTPDEGELEAQWLQEAGYGFLVSRYNDGKELTEDEIHALTDSLPRNHAAVVKKRVDTLNATLRKKQKYTTKIDVRNIFPQQRIAEPVVIHSQLVEEPDESDAKPAVRPTTLPRGMKLSNSYGGENIWIRQMYRDSSMVQSPVTFDRSQSVPCDPKTHSSDKHSPLLHQTPALACSGFRSDPKLVDSSGFSPVQVEDSSGFSHAPVSDSAGLRLVPLKDSSSISPAPCSQANSPDQHALLSDNNELILKELLEGLQISQGNSLETGSVLGTRCDSLNSDSVLISRSDSHESDSVLTSHSRSKSSSCNTLDSLDSGLDLAGSNLNKDQSSSKDSLDYLTSPHFTTSEPRSNNTDKDLPLQQNVPPSIETVSATSDQAETRKVQSANKAYTANIEQAQTRKVQSNSELFSSNSAQAQTLGQYITSIGKKSEQVGPKEFTVQAGQDVVRKPKCSENCNQFALRFGQDLSKKPKGHRNPKELALQVGQDLSKKLKSPESPKQFALRLQDSQDLSEKPKSPESPHQFANVQPWPLPVGSRKRKRVPTKGPKSPASPRGEVIHPEFGGRQNRGSAKAQGPFAKNKGGYSMSGLTEEVQDNAEMGVEMLSLQQHTKRNSQLSPISDSDIEFTFNLEENGKDFNGHTSWPSNAADNMPNFTLIKDRLGVTRIEDISDTDLQYVRKQALLEMTHMFDAHNLGYSRRRSKKKYKEHGIFGVPLQTMLDYDQKRVPNPNAIHVPIVFSEVIKYLVKNCLDSEGILRIPGSSSRVKQLRDELEEKFYTGTFIWNEELTTNDVAALMKQFLRELPVPLLTDEYIDAFAQVENLEDRKQQLHALNLLVLLLPNVHRDTLHDLLLFLELIIEHSSSNRMSLHNVAMIMAPNLFMAPKVRSSNPGGGGSKDNLRAWEVEIKMAAGTSNIMKMMIKYRQILWTIPTYLISLVRRQYELEQLRRNKDRPRMKFLAKKDKTEVYKQPNIRHETDFREGVVRVQAPHLTKSSTAIQLDANMTAGDIVAKFRVIQGSQTLQPKKLSQSQKSTGNQQQVFADPRNFHSAGDDTFLFEKGGNLGERCLPNDTNMMALYKVNPNAEWIIKHRASSYSFR